MKKLLFFIGFVIFSFTLFAKQRQDKEILSLIKDIKLSYSKVESFEAEFKQIRKSPLLKKPAVTFGKFYFKKPDKIVLKFTKPYKLSIYYKKNKLYRFNLKTKRYSVLNIKRHRENALNYLNVSKTFAFLNKYFLIKRIKTEKKGIYLVLIPKKRRVKKRLKIVEMWLREDNYMFQKLYFEQKDDTETTIILKNLKINSEIPDSIFKFSKKGFKKEKWQ